MDQIPPSAILPPIEFLLIHGVIYRKETAMSGLKEQEQGTITGFLHDSYLLTWVDAFLLDRHAQNLSRGTVEFYRRKLK